jgi:hypothetical protein
MKNKYILPEVLDLKFLHEIFYEIKEKRVNKMSWDWKICKEISDEIKCSLLHFSDEINSFHFDLVHENTSSILDEVKQIINRTNVLPNDFSKGIFISAVNKEEVLLNDKLRLEKFLSYCFPEKNIDFSKVGNLFSELYMNICQHSEISKGYIYIAKPDKHGDLNMFFSDLGVGIATKIKNYFTDKSFNNDAEAIDYATELYITTKSGPTNQGKGLDTIKTSTIALGGKLGIYSGQGLLEITEDKKAPSILKYRHLGSLITLKININNLETEKVVTYDEEIDF